MMRKRHRERGRGERVVADRGKCRGGHQRGDREHPGVGAARHEQASDPKRGEHQEHRG
jgi:hypothetical protein